MNLYEEDWKMKRRESARALGKREHVREETNAELVWALHIYTLNLPICP